MCCEHRAAAVCIEDGVAMLGYDIVGASNGRIDDVDGLTLGVNEWYMLVGTDNGGIKEYGTELFAPTGMLQLVGMRGP